MNNNNFKYAIIIVVMIILFVGIYYIFKNINENNKEKIEYLRDYKVNEYIQTYISDENMARIYLNDYVNNMIYNTEESYYLLAENYRNKRFGSYENYVNYLKNLDNYDITMASFYKQERNGRIFFGVYDTSNNLYIFKTKGVMQYSVYLDDYTVEIW